MRGWFARCVRGLLALIAVGAWSLGLQVGVGAGTAFAFAPPPPVTMPGIAEIPAATTAAAVDTTVAVAGADAAVTGGVTAGAICTAATGGACLLAGVVMVGAAYGAMKLMHFSWGAHHVQQVAAQPTTTTTYGGGGWDVCNNSQPPPNSQYDQCQTATGNGTYGTLSTTPTLPLPSSPSGSSPSGHLGLLHVSYTGTGPYSYYTYTSCSITSPANSALTRISGSGPQSISIQVPDCPSGGGSIVYYGYVFFGDVNQNNSMKSQYRLGATPTTPAPLPQHQLKVVQRCYNTDGSLASTTTYSSAVFDDSSSTVPDLSGQSCPAGTVPGSGELDETTVGQPDTPLYTQPAPAVSPSNPCAPVGAACAPTLQHATATGTWTDSQTQPSSSLDGSYRCEWLGPASTSPRPDGGPLPMTDCVAASGTPDTSTGTDTQPRTGPAVDNAGNNCFASGFGWNPIDWVYTPVKCVLEWAFVPTDAQLQTDFGPLQNALASSPPGVVVTGVGTLFAPFVSMPSGAGDCNGPDVNVNLPGWQPAGGATGTTAAPAVSGGTSHTLDIHPWSMCNPVGQWVHSWVLPFVTALLYVAAFVIVARIFTRVIGYDAPFDSDASEATA